MTLIFGHKSPDSDATGSPIVWQWYLNEVRHINAEAVLLGDPNKEALFMLNRWSVPTPRIIDDVSDGQNVIVVDTNNPAELPANICQANVVEIIDHHLLHGGLSTRIPIPVSIRPLACTATVMFEIMGTEASQMPDTIKGIALTCILSDTLEFRSPTTTAIDQNLAVDLANQLDIIIPDYAAEMFAAKSDMSSYTDAEMLTVDSKSFEIGGKKIRISVLETTSPAQILDRQDGLMAAMSDSAELEGIDQILLFVVDILREQATLLLPNEFTRELARKSFSVDASGDSVLLPGIVSRKKQIIPNLKL